MAEESPSASTNNTPNTSKRRHCVFADPVAFRYLEEDSATVVVERRGRLKGYELYIVEQWACSRVHPTFVITTYTGDPNHSVLVGVLGVPADEESWSPRLRVYFKAIAQFHARPKETPLGMLMVTNLSSFPSALTVIPVPDGDVRKHREDFLVNESLKRLGCSGRSGKHLKRALISLPSSRQTKRAALVIADVEFYWHIQDQCRFFCRLGCFFQEMLHLNIVHTLTSYRHEFVDTSRSYAGKILPII